VQTRIKTRIAEHVSSCGGNAVVVLDEVQKMLPGALEVLVPALDSRGSLSTYSRSTSSDQRPASATPEKSLDYLQALSPTRRHGDRPERVVQVSTERVIFILISDIGADKMIKLVLEYGNRTLIPRQLMRHEVRASLDEQWSRLRLGKLVKEVVPYLPLEPEHIRLIMRGKLMHTASEYRYKYWLDLIVDPDVVFFLASPPFVKYSVFQAKMSSRGGAIANVAAAISTDSQCLNSPHCDQSTTSSSNGGSSTHPTAKTKIFATWGARSLVNSGVWMRCIISSSSIGDRHSRPFNLTQVRCRT
jgi:hypothetical protein